jgi:hypothetical protein
VTGRGVTVAAAILTEAERDATAAEATVKSAAVEATPVEATAEAPTGACRGGRDGTECRFFGKPLQEEEVVAEMRDLLGHAYGREPTA